MWGGVDRIGDVDYGRTLAATVPGARSELRGEGDGGLDEVAGAKASSSALIGSGLDSVIEVSSAAAVAWQFAGRDPEVRERVAPKVIGASFFALRTRRARPGPRARRGR